jgi:hypothetical protein
MEQHMQMSLLHLLFAEVSLDGVAMSFKISRKEWEGCCNLVTAKLIFM